MKRKKTFKHASNLRTQAAMMRLRIALGPAGYGLYFMLAEHIYQTGLALQETDFDLLAYEFHASEADVRAVVKDFGLFVLTDEGYILAEQAFSAEQSAKGDYLPATPSDVSDSSDSSDKSDKSDSSDSPDPSDSLDNLISQLTADEDLMDDLCDELGPPERLRHIIDSIIIDQPTISNYEELIKLVRSRIVEYLADHPKPVYKRREWMG